LGTRACYNEGGARIVARGSQIGAHEAPARAKPRTSSGELFYTPVSSVAQLLAASATLRVAKLR